MAGYGQKHWHKVTEKPADYTDVVVVYIPPREYAAAAFGRYVADDDTVTLSFEHEIALNECLKWCYAKDFFSMG